MLLRQQSYKTRWRLSETKHKCNPDVGYFATITLSYSHKTETPVVGKWLLRLLCNSILELFCFNENWMKCSIGKNQKWYSHDTEALTVIWCFIGQISKRKIETSCSRWNFGTALAERGVSEASLHRVFLQWLWNGLFCLLKHLITHLGMKQTETSVMKKILHIYLLGILWVSWEVKP